jgi:hypothetical protein
VLALLLYPACPESVCPAETDDESAGTRDDGSSAGTTETGATDSSQAPLQRQAAEGQCRNVADLFPEALPISPNKALCNMTDVKNVNQTCFNEADANFYSALTEEIMSRAIVWINLAMPNTGTTRYG